MVNSSAEKKKKCLICHHVRTDSDAEPDDACPKCGRLYAKIEQLQEEGRLYEALPQKKPSTKLIDCPDCGASISARAPTCPKCGAPQKVVAGGNHGNSNNQSNIPIVVGIVSLLTGVFSLFVPYFAAVYFAPMAFICGIIAFLMGSKKTAIAGILLSLVAFWHIKNVSNNIEAAAQKIEGDAEKSQKMLDELRNGTFGKN